MDKDDMLSMSDEDFLKLDSPPVVEAPASTEGEQQPAIVPVEPVVEATPPAQEPAPVVEPVVETPVVPPVEVPDGAPVVEGEQQQAPAVEPAPVVETPTQEEQAPDYKAMYEGLLAPIKANGKEIQLKSHAELVQLAQQGANYTRKMQDIAPHRKTLLMLENNGIDQEQLSFLIDLSKKDPAAIQKFLKDSEINPLDIDVDAEPSYKGGNHRVTDEEANFRAAIDDATASETGRVVLQAINGTWDQASKELLFSQPGILETMIQQQDAGFYERIAGEVDRRRVLGQIPSGMNFLQAYKAVGDQMVAAGQMQDLIEKVAPPVQTPPVAAAPVAVRVAPVKPAVVPNAKAEAAAPTRAAPNAAKKLVNPLAMDDDEFMKTFQHRL
ncbi:hypothetical protein D3C87_1144530 [compost metagenome]